MRTQAQAYLLIMGRAHSHTHACTLTHLHTQIVGIVIGQQKKLHFPPDMPPAHAPYAQLTMRCLSYDVAERPTTESVLQDLESMMVKV